MHLVPSIPLVVAIPAKEEAVHIVPCLQALDAQSVAQFTDIVVYVNNSTDNTAQLARTVAVRPGTTVHVIEKQLPRHRSNAGFARREAMARAAALAVGQGFLFTTDADGQVDTDWLAAMLDGFAKGADVVAGWAELDPIDWGRIPRQLHEDDARECAYDALCDEIHARRDPDPFDPWPRHTQHSGASLGVTAGAYEKSGGVPLVECGEDRAFVAALRRIDARVRHAPEVHVTVSGRTQGRSEGGMADTLRRRMIRPDTHLDPRLEPAAVCALRARSRRLARAAWAMPGRSTAELADSLALGEHVVTGALRAEYFGQAWETLETISPALMRKAVCVTALDAEMQAARAILADLHDACADPGTIELEA